MSIQNTFSAALLFGSLLATALPAAAEPTFSADVAPIIFNRCTSCHRPGEAAPFSLMSYDDVAKRAKLIAAVTASRLMPPWRAEPASYPYKDSRRLTDAELSTIQDWVKAGMPKGDLSKVPPLPNFPEGWQLGTPDVIVKLQKGFTVPAEGPDIYTYLRIPLNLPETKWVRAIEFRASASKVVHHVLFLADDTISAQRIEAEAAAHGSGISMKFTRGMVPLGGIAVGGQPHLLPEGLALELPKNTDLMFQYHFHPTGKEETEQSTVGLYFAKDAPEHTLANIELPVAYSLFSGLDIPAGQKDFRISDSFTLPVDVQAIAIGAHAHYIGETMRMTAAFPDGSVRTLLDIKDWDFAWQDHYFFESTVFLPKGTRLDSEVTWDNSPSNPKNPSRPPIAVHWGEQTKDEMGGVALTVYPASEKDLMTLRRTYRMHMGQIARDGLLRDPTLFTKIREIMGDSAQGPPR